MMKGQLMTTSIRQSIAFPDVGSLNKGTPKKKHIKDGKEMWIQGSDLGSKLRISLHPGASPVIVDALNRMTPEKENSNQMSLTPVTYGPNYATQQGWETERIRAMICFPSVTDHWEWSNRAYSSGIKMAQADDERYIDLRNPLNVREYLVKNGEPYRPYTPGEKITYERNGKKVELPMKTEGRLRLFLPAVGSLVLFTLKTRSYYDRINIDAQMRGIQFMANTLNGGNAVGIPFFIYRRQEQHPWINENGQATMQTKWHLQVELDRTWVAVAMRRVSSFALTGETVKGLLTRAEETGAFPVEQVVTGYVESDGDEHDPEDEKPGTLESTTTVTVTSTPPPPPPSTTAQAQPAAQNPTRCEACGQILPTHAPGCANGKQPVKRPYPADVFKTKFGEVVQAIIEKNNLDKEIGERERRLVASMLDGIFNGEKTMRYEVCKWLTGYASTKDMSKAEIKAILKIMDVGSFEDAPRSEAIQEFRWGHEAALIAAGQLQMPGMNGQP